VAFAAFGDAQRTPRFSGSRNNFAQLCKGTFCEPIFKIAFECGRLFSVHDHACREKAVPMA
jgi:hypothetical protein